MDEAGIPPPSPAPPSPAPPAGRWRGLWRHWTEGLDFQAAFVMTAATVLLILYHYDGSSGFYRRYFGQAFQGVALRDLFPACYWYGSSLVLLGVVPLLLGRLVLHRPLTEWGVGLGDWRFGLKASLGMFALFLPVLWVVSHEPNFAAKYPLFGEARRDLSHLVLNEVGYATYFIGWEFMFRGFMLFGLKPRLGYHAVWVQMIPFAIMHFGKAQIETLAAVAAGIILGYLALRSRSFWYGWLLHALVAVSNDLWAIYQKGGVGA
ncbi:MAG TPA: CPBP family intramembrane metalloprotease [Myxococcota bacterium]|nr:CPBP family intramembrane metalloprotease [Myxococcota bacterium]